MKNVITGFLILVSMVASAQQKSGVNTVNTNRPEGDFANINTAYNLAKYGYENNDALSLLNAARIMSQIPVQDANARGLVQSNAEGGGTGIVDTTKKKAVQLDPFKLLEDAKLMAASDRNTLQFITEMAKNIKPQTRGRVGGPALTYERVLASSTDNFTIRFYGLERAKVYVKGDGDTDLDLYVYDYDGNLIGSDEDYTDGCYLEWTPKWTGSFTIKVKNRGRVYNNYTLITN